MSYYQDLINKIRDLINENKLNEAGEVLKEELNMPYIPLEFEKELVSLNEEVLTLLKEGSENKELSILQIEKYLHGDEKQQLLAASALLNKNLRNYIDLIKEYLSKKPNKMAVALLIDGMIEQQIADQFMFENDGIEYTFIPAYLTSPCDSDGFIEARYCLKEWLENDNPSMFEMAMSILINDVYLHLPLSYEDSEGERIAFKALKEVSEMMDYKEYELIVQKYHLHNLVCD